MIPSAFLVRLPMAATWSSPTPAARNSWRETPSGCSTPAVIGTFASVTLPSLPVGLIWNTNSLSTNGTLSVIAEHHSGHQFNFNRQRQPRLQRLRRRRQCLLYFVRRDQSFRRQLDAPVHQSVRQLRQFQFHHQRRYHRAAKLLQTGIAIAKWVGWNAAQCPMPVHTARRRFSWSIFKNYVAVWGQDFESCPKYWKFSQLPVSVATVELQTQLAGYPIF